MPPASIDTYKSRAPIGRAGQIADLSPCQVDSFINESATPCDVGRVVARGTLADAGHAPACKPFGLDADQFLGITVENPLNMVASSDGLNTVNFKQFEDVPVMRWGKIFVLAAEQVRRGDAVIILTAGGGTLASPMGGVAGAGRILLPNAEWETNTASGQIGRIYIRGGATGRLTA